MHGLGGMLALIGMEMTSSLATRISACLLFRNFAGEDNMLTY